MHIFVAGVITLGREIMNLPVDLDDQLGSCAIEVRNIGPNGMLPAELNPAG